MSASRLTSVVLFTAAYLLAAAAGALALGNAEFLIYIGVMVVLAGAVFLVDRRVRLPAAILWCLSLWGLLHVAGGLVPVPGTWPAAGEHRVLYSLWLWPERLKYDQVVHAYGFAVATWLCWCGLHAVVAGQRGETRATRSLEPTFGVLVLSVAAGTGLGAANEVVEFAATLVLEDTNVGGYVNTGWDLVANLTGATAAAVLIRVFAGKR